MLQFNISRLDLRVALLHLLDFVNQRTQFAATRQQARSRLARPNSQRAIGSDDFTDDGNEV